MAKRSPSARNADGTAKEFSLFAERDHEPIDIRSAGIEPGFIGNRSGDGRDLLVVSDHRQQMASRTPVVRVVFGNHAVHAQSNVDCRVT